VSEFVTFGGRQLGNVKDLSKIYYFSSANGKRREKNEEEMKILGIKNVAHNIFVVYNTARHERGSDKMPRE
jgi:hypothetical protein